MYKLLFKGWLFLFIFSSFIANGQVRINELGISPSVNDGSIFGGAPTGSNGKAEWIELYNTDLCNPVNISNYIIGTYIAEDGNGAAFVLPANLTLPAGGFAIIRGANAAVPPAGVLDIVVSNSMNQLCIQDQFEGLNRMWFKNAGSWIALYNKNGVALDMAKWGSPLSTDLASNPCVPTYNGGVSSLQSYASFSGAVSISSSPSTIGKTFVRVPDGGPWSSVQDNETTSYGTRNRPVTASISYSGSPWCTNAGLKSVTLNGTGNYTGGSYASTTGLSINSSNGQINVATSTPGTYTVNYVLNGYTCNGVIATTTVQINQPVTPQFTQIGPLCQNAPAPSLPSTSSNGISGTWLPNTVNTSSLGNANYVFTPSASACAVSQTLTIGITTTQTPQFSAINPICQNTTPPALPSTSSNGIAGTWSPATISTGTAGSSLYIFQPTAGACATQQSLSITISPSVQPQFSAIGPYCVGETPTTLNVTSINGISGTWSPASISTINPGTSTYTFTPNGSTCASIYTTQLTINSGVIPQFNPIAPLCKNANAITLPSTSLNGIAGSWQPAIISTNSVGISNYTFTPSNTGSGCNAQQTMAVEILEIPSLVVNDPAMVCSPQVIDLTLPSVTAGTQNAQNFDYWTDNTATSWLANPSSIANSGTYFIRAVNGTCYDIKSVNVSIHQPPTLQVGNDTTICAGSSLQLNAISSSVCLWNGSIPNGTVVTPSASTTYMVQSTMNGCTATDDIYVQIAALPTVSAGQDVVLCEGVAWTLQATGADYYVWNTSDPNGTIIYPTLGTTVYSVVGTTNSNCSSTDEVVVQVVSAPIVDFSSSINAGCAPLDVSFNLSSNTNGAVSWDFGNGQLSNELIGNAVFSVEGCYDVTVSVTENGCTVTQAYPNMICVNEGPNAQFTPSQTEVSMYNSNVYFTNQTTGANVYTWIFGDGTPNSNTDSPYHNYMNQELGEFTVQLIATAAGGCTDTASAVLTMKEELIFWVPNSFTPDANEFNPVFKPIMTSGYELGSYEMKIFNRWGELVFDSKDPEFGWDGSFGDGSETTVSQDQTYSYVISFTLKGTEEKQRVSGFVNLLK